jgi:molybdopterin converting factor small subunit
MKVILDSNVSIKDEFEPGEVELREQNATLHDLLRELASQGETLDLINLESGEKGDDVREILVNGKDCLLLEQLETRLSDGDTVMIRLWFDPLGGG